MRHSATSNSIYLVLQKSNTDSDEVESEIVSLVSSVLCSVWAFWIPHLPSTWIHSKRIKTSFTFVPICLECNFHDSRIWSAKHNPEVFTGLNVALSDMCWDYFLMCRMHEGSGSITSWLKIESAEETFTKNTLQAFFIVFFPIGGLQCLAQVFMYIRNPNMPQYIISFLLEHIDVSKENLPNYLILFGCLEITLGIYLWSLVFFYMSAILGCATTIKERIQSLR